MERGELTNRLKDGARKMGFFDVISGRDLSIDMIFRKLEGI